MRISDDDDSILASRLLFASLFAFANITLVASAIVSFLLFAGRTVVPVLPLVAAFLATHLSLQKLCASVCLT